MRRALLVVSLFCAAAVSAAAEPPGTNAPTNSAPLRQNARAPTAPDAAAATAPTPTPAATTSDTATAPAEARDAKPDATTKPAPHTAAAAEVAQVELRKPTDDTVCHKVRPTGSLISVQRCYSRSAVVQSRDAELLRSDLEHIRDQENIRQAQDAATSMAGRRIAP